MRKSRYTEQQIVGILKESEAGLPTAELCRKHGISEQTFYRWKAKYGGLEVSDRPKEADRLPFRSSRVGTFCCMSFDTPRDVVFWKEEERGQV